MQIFGIILCIIIAGLFLIIGFLMDEVEKWKKIAANYKKSYESTKKYMRQTYKSIESIYGNCGVNIKDWRDTDAIRSSKRD